MAYSVRMTMAELGDLVSQYETNLLLFERDAPPEVLSAYRELFQGPDVNFMRALIGTVKERRMIEPVGIASAPMVGTLLAGLGQVEAGGGPIPWPDPRRTRRPIRGVRSYDC